MPSREARLIAASVVATLAFWAYTRTLVPGVDLGDTGGFQAAVLWPESSARQAYPLYYALARPFVGAVGIDNPARTLNLFSGLCGAFAVGILVALASTITRSVLAGVAAGLMLTFSYTFWSQAIIAEVYTLHLALIGACLGALHLYAVRPDRARLLLFFAVYALSFGNHLSMILLFVPFAIFLVWHAPQPRQLFRADVVALAVACAAMGALQYSWNLAAIWTSPQAPSGAAEKLAAFWFDVTKADWRESMVLGVGASQAGDRLAMWWFDLRQQFGIGGVAAAIIGAIALWRHDRRWAVVCLLAWLTVAAFALTYNVGDAHVFFLAAHYFTALFAGASSLAFGTRSRLRTVAAILLIGYAGWRGWDTWPAVDRHLDRRGEQFVARLTTGITGSAALVTHLDWQLENVLLYHQRFVSPGLDWSRFPDVAIRLPYFVEETQRTGRDVVLSADAARQAIAAYGPSLTLIEDSVLQPPLLREAVERVPPGAPYVLTLLTPPRGTALSPETLGAILGHLTGGRVTAAGAEPYWVMAGLGGEAPAFVRGDAHPFRDTFLIAGEPYTVRMDSWLGTDTFRRAGFGHVLKGRTRMFIVERGVGFSWIRADGQSVPPTYAAGLFAPQPRFRIPASAPRLARAEQ